MRNWCLLLPRQKANLDQLISEMQLSVSLDSFSEDAVIVTNVRHFEALSHAHESIERVLVGLENKITGDFLAQDIRECLYYLGEITGEITNDVI